MSELALQRIHEAKQHRLTRLDLGNCGLTELPDELFELTWLEELILSESWQGYSLDEKDWDIYDSLNEGEANNIKFIPSKIVKLKKLKKLIANGSLDSKWDLNDLKPLKELIQLEQLSVNYTKVSDITPLKTLIRLKLLDISSTEVRDLTPLEYLIQLEQLYVIETLVIDINPLKGLIQLQLLQLALTSIKDLNPLSRLSKLRVLYLHDTQIVNLAPIKEIFSLKLLTINRDINDISPVEGLINLEILRAQEIKIANLKFLKKLTKLKELFLYDSPVTDLTPLENLTQLQKLYFNSTQVNDLTPLKNLTKLKELHFSGTLVKDITHLKNLRLLRELYMAYTKVTDLTPLKHLNQLKRINIDGCSIINPPKEIVEQGIEAIQNFFKQIEKQGKTEELYEAKLIIVGEGGTGKTTLYEKLKDSTHQVGNTPETHGINIHEGLEIRHAAIDNQLFHANLWDFGGQELQYMTHQFFLTPRALYVLMMDARKEAPNLAYWLKIISLLGKDSQDSTEKVRLLLVFNKRQNSTGTPPQYQDTLQYYQDHLDVQYLEVDFSENDKRFENLKDTIERNLVTLPIVKSQLPRKWKDVREDLRQEAKTRTHISTERLAEICSKHSITDEQDQLQLSDYLHKLGSLLHFQNDKTLINWVFLSPEWVVEGVYGFLKNDLIARQNGKFTEDDFFKILSTTKNDKNYTYTRADSAKILQLMTKNNFDICYESANGNYVAAQLLPENAPPQYKWHTDKGALKFRYQYPVMPKGLMSRLIVRLSEYLEIMDNVEVVWKKGAILSIKTDKNDPKSLCRILMKEDDAESKDGLRQIIFEVMGDPASHRKHALQRVREEVESLHKRWFRSIKADEMVPCCCSECRKNTNPELYKLEKLLTLREKRAETVCYSSGEDISIFHLLEGVYEESEIKNMGGRGGFREY